MPTKKSVVSIIIPVRNRPNLANIAISSAFNQKGNFTLQIIVVDDSSNGLKKELALSNKVKYLRNFGRHHPSIARNLGLKLIKGDYVSFLDADDYYGPRFIETSISEFRKDDSVFSTAVLSHKIYDENLSFLTKTKLQIFNFIKEFVLICSWLSTRRLDGQWVYLLQLSHQLFSKVAIKDLVFNEKVPFCEDWLFSLQAIQKGLCVIIPKRLTNYRYSQSSNTFMNSPKINMKSKTYQTFYRRLSSFFPNSLGVLFFNLYYRNVLIKNA